MRHATYFAVAIGAFLFGNLASASAQSVPPGAVTCSGCHAASGGSSVPPLAGRPAADITAAMASFRTGTRPATVMDRIAKGFTETETVAIAEWLSRQKRMAP